MNIYRILSFIAGRRLWIALAVLLMQPDEGAAAVEETFDVLQIGTKTYKKVTVTTKARTYVFLIHSMGMTSIKVSELPRDIREKLGYVEKPKPALKDPKAWAKKEFARLDPQIKQWEQRLGVHPPTGVTMAAIKPNTVFAALAGLLLFYLFFCHCCRLICNKTGNPPGGLIWLPVLQLIPLYRAAGMSPWWFLASFIPVLNIIAGILWSFKIVQARLKSVWVSLFLLLPVTCFFAFLYLAFSSAPAPKEKRVVEIMTLDAA